MYTIEREARAEAEANRLRLDVLANGRAAPRRLDRLRRDAAVDPGAGGPVLLRARHPVPRAGRHLHGAAARRPTETPNAAGGIEEILQQYVPRPNHPASQFAEAMRTGRPVAIREVTEQEMVRARPAAELVHKVGDLRARSGLIVPLQGVRGLIGALSLTNSTDGPGDGTRRRRVRGAIRRPGGAVDRERLALRVAAAYLPGAPAEPAAGNAAAGPRVRDCRAVRGGRRGYRGRRRLLRRGVDRPEVGDDRARRRVRARAPRRRP